MYVSKFLTFGLSAVLELAGGVRLSADWSLYHPFQQRGCLTEVYCLCRSAMPSACTVRH